MAKGFPLQMLLDMTVEKRDDSAKRLGQLMANERSNADKLKMLEEYREEYRQRMVAPGQNIGPEQLRNFSAFLQRLDEAVQQQQAILDHTKQATLRGQQEWIEHRNKVKAFDTLAERYQQQENRKEAKREQKFNDEHAAKNFRDKKIAEQENDPD